MTAMEMGFPISELKTMSWARLLFFLRVKSIAYDRHKRESEKEQPSGARNDSVREATQADISMLY